MKILILAAAAFALTACVSNPPRRVQQQAVYDVRVSATSKDEVSAEDISVSLRPITVERAQNMSTLFATYTYWNPREPSKQANAKSIMVSLPAFEVQVSNASGQAVSFQKAVIRLVDDAGNSYQPQLKQDIVDGVQEHLESVRSRGWAVDSSGAISSARALKLFDRNFESLPGLTEKRILAFDIENSADSRAYLQWMARTRYLRVMIYNVPVKFDTAGNVTKAAKFEYVFDVVKR